MDAPEVWRRTGDRMNRAEKKGVIGLVDYDDLLVLKNTEGYDGDPIQKTLDRILALEGGYEKLIKLKKDATNDKKTDHNVEVVDWLKFAKSDKAKKIIADKKADPNSKPSASNVTDGPATKKAKTEQKTQSAKKVTGKGKEKADPDEYVSAIVPGLKDESIAKRFAGLQKSPTPEVREPKGLRNIEEDEAMIGCFKLDATPKRIIVGFFSVKDLSFMVLPISHTPGGYKVHPKSAEHITAWLNAAEVSTPTTALEIETQEEFDKVVDSWHEDEQRPMRDLAEAKEYVWKVGREKGKYLDWGYVNPSEFEEEDAETDTILTRLDKTDEWLQVTDDHPDYYVKPTKLNHTVRSVAMLADQVSQKAATDIEEQRQGMNAKRVALEQALALVDNENNSVTANRRVLDASVTANRRVLDASVGLTNTAFDIGIRLLQSTLTARGNLPMAYAPQVSFPIAWTIRETDQQLAVTAAGADGSFRCNDILNPGPAMIRPTSKGDGADTTQGTDKDSDTGGAIEDDTSGNPPNGDDGIE